MRSVDVLGIDVEITTGDPLVLLRERAVPHRVLPIFVGEAEAVAIALGFAGRRPEQPLTHDLLAEMVDCLDAEVDFVEVTELRDGAFIAELGLQGPHGPRRIDSRPSDAIALAARVDAPVFVADELLDAAGAELSVDPAGHHVVRFVDRDEQIVEDEVSRFREFLDETDPSEFDDPGDQ
jgi:bifunctional DNase/RNase